MNRKPGLHSLTFLLGIFLLAAPAAAQETFEATVVKAVSGDALEVRRDKAKQTETYHLAGVDAPEPGQPFSKESADFLGKTATGKKVKITPQKEEQPGQKAALILLPDGRNLSHLMLEEGLVWWYRMALPHDPVLDKTEHQTRKLKKGIWSDRDTMPPWAWRSRLEETGGGPIKDR
ncbi:MAG: thermonuclease family protein [Deltaproteobacteria bacterium]|nr:thermonuclease family protein [Deltaproteobacteria bacterium]